MMTCHFARFPTVHFAKNVYTDIMFRTSGTNNYKLAELHFSPCLISYLNVYSRISSRPIYQQSVRLIYEIKCKWYGLCILKTTGSVHVNHEVTISKETMTTLTDIQKYNLRSLMRIATLTMTDGDGG